MKKVLLVMMMFALLFAFAACGEEAETPVVEEQPAAESSLPTVDRAGLAITVPEQVETIMSIAPAATQILVDLGFGEQIIAVDTNSVGLEGISADLPAFDLMTPDVEKMAAMAPDVIFVTGMSMYDGENPYQPLVDMGICVVCIPSSESIDAIREDILFYGAVLQADAEAEAIVAEMDAEIDRIRAIGETVEEKKTVYFEIGAAPYIYSFGTGVFLNEMIEIIGGENVFADLNSWISVDPEVALATDPDVIMTNVNYLEDPVGEILSRPGWDALSAVQNEEVYLIDNFSSSLANHNIVKALQQMAEAAYPELY